MLKFLEKFRSESGEATVKEVFGDQLPQIEREFHQFLNQSRYPYVIQPVKPAAPESPLQAAPAALVEASLGLLALSSERSELAQEHAKRAIALDANSPKGYELQAYISLEKQDFDQAAAQAELALQRGSRDSQLFVLMGDSYTQGRNSERPDAERARVSMYENAINLSPRRLEVYQRLAAALMPVEKPTETDLQFLNIGLRAFPGEDWLRVGTALVEHRLGRHDNAAATLDKVLRPDSTLDPSEREHALNLRRSWWVEAMNEELRSAAALQDIGAARAAIAKYRERLADVPEIATYLNELEASLKQAEQPPPKRGRK
jgi:tetratricopeptide (TPR) repeat protein